MKTTKTILSLALAAYFLLAFLCVLMTYFGVNYFLSGMHSYGQNDDVHHLFVYLYIAIGLVVLLAFTSRKRINSLYVKH